MLVDKYQLKEELHNGVVTVVFEKTDGTERTMRCTLANEYLPQVLTEYDEDGNPIVKSQRKQNDNVVNVWDVDKSAWRSFRLDSVKSLLQE